jgi:hypothetical protein
MAFTPRDDGSEEAMGTAAAAMTADAPLELLGSSPARRGRPPKKRRNGDGKQPASNKAVKNDDPPEDGERKPREERPYSEYFADLDVAQQLAVVTEEPLEGTIRAVQVPYSPDATWKRQHYGGELVPKSGTLTALPQCNFYAIDQDHDMPDQPAFSRPDDYYLHHVEPAEDELARRVEYDMDEQGLADMRDISYGADLCWLKLVNQQRVAEEFDEVSENIFELIMDQLEKEWFNLVTPDSKASHHSRRPKT